MGPGRFQETQMSSLAQAVQATHAVHPSQRALALDAASVVPSDPSQRAGFDIGWDHAHHGLVPPAELLHAGTPVAQGWLAGKAVFGARGVVPNRFHRQWLALRLLAWRKNMVFDGKQVTPHYLMQIQVAHCPVTRARVGGGAGQADAAFVDILNPASGFVAGNLATLSLQAVQARAGMDLPSALRQARAQQAGAAPASGLDAAAWWRLAVLQSFATPMSFAEAARLPLAVLPPNRVRQVNAAQALQVLVTLLFAAPGWSKRCLAMSALQPTHTLRLEFNLFVGAMAPRVLEAGQEAAALRLALEDAWLHERVLRRWQHFMLSLGEAAAQRLLDSATAAGLAAAPAPRRGPSPLRLVGAQPGAGKLRRMARAPATAASDHAASAPPMGRPSTTARPFML